MQMERVELFTSDPECLATWSPGLLGLPSTRHCALQRAQPKSQCSDSKASAGFVNFECSLEVWSSKDRICPSSLKLRAFIGPSPLIYTYHVTF